MIVNVGVIVSQSGNLPYRMVRLSFVSNYGVLSIISEPEHY